MKKSGSRIFNRQTRPIGDRRKNVINTIIEAGSEGVYINDIARSLGIGISTVTSCLQAEDMIYEETARGRTRLFWCGGEMNA